ncbi:hypothetical protein V6N11_083206 [Hibiscus sabdariffa]|uniref:Reverse transcriptase zinc-binding domain-containing protein n=1 Tax=Hibiscus sabdariffa TaxID=183260 RepID=A0ABR2QL68_9ROSI
MIGSCLLSISRPKCSPLWRALSNVWDTVRENIFWLVGDGNDVHLWNDTWVPSLGHLRPWASSTSSNIDDLHFEDLLLDDGHRNVGCLLDLVHNSAVPHIMGVLPPPFGGLRDTVAWKLTPTGSFSIASAYDNLVDPTWDAPDSKWYCIWLLPVTQRIRVFLWMVLHQRLMTNVERVRRGLSSDPSCPSCGCCYESILHILRDCPPTRCFWQPIIPCSDHMVFFSSPLEHWLVFNLEASRGAQSNLPLVLFIPISFVAALEA